MSFLNLGKRGKIRGVDFDAKENRFAIHFETAKALAQQVCTVGPLPEAGKVSCYDPQSRRSWRQMGHFGKRTATFARCPGPLRKIAGQTLPGSAPWEGGSKHFTKDFEKPLRWRSWGDDDHETLGTSSGKMTSASGGGFCACGQGVCLWTGRTRFALGRVKRTSARGISIWTVVFAEHLGGATG